MCICVYVCILNIAKKVIMANYFTFCLKFLSNFLFSQITRNGWLHWLATGHLIYNSLL